MAPADAAAAFVLDASVTIAWCFEDEASGYADRILQRLSGQAALVPHIWALEVTNALLASERKRRLRPADSARFLTLLRGLPIILEPEPSLREMGSILSLAREQGLSAYDAVYLYLATTRELPLATLDDTLKRAATTCGVSLA
ncbi:MAG: type II toxin-antitoxin system VapC family toxin [Firmicutes bacterium]|nr:type II toxin-antitoxin system VapC family toxin [Bacillota bacterium]